MEFKEILKKIKERIEEKYFEINLKKFIEIDNNYYEKILEKNLLIDILEEYSKKNYYNSEYSKIQVLTVGNPEIIFRLGIEALRNNYTEIFISIDDFCLAQNSFIISFFNKFFLDNNINIKIILDNLTKEPIIIDNSKKYDITVCISDNYRYDYYKNDIDNIYSYPYGIFEVYSDDIEFENIKKSIFNYSSLNGFEMINYDEDIDYCNVINMMNSTKDSSSIVVLTKDSQKQVAFNNKVKNKEIIINKNPLKYMNFNFEF